MLTIPPLANATRSLTVVRAVGTVVLGPLAVYALLAFRRVNQDSWPRIVVKSAGVFPLYLGALAITRVATYVWAVLT